MNLKIFEQSKNFNENHQEFWKARELAKILEYKDFGNFENVIAKAKMACIKSGYDTDEHFGEITEMVEIGSWSQRSFSSYSLSRYACYLIVQNADPSKEIVALGQTYFALQTRKQEIYDQFGEDQQRMYLRDDIKIRNKNLASAANKAWVTNHANFTDAGYMWLYWWMRQVDIHKHKKLKKEQKILDHMNSEELWANIFRATQTEAKITREGIQWQDKASIVHYEIGKKVRKTIKEIWWTMPEKLPSVDDIKEAKKRVKNNKRLKYR